MNEIIESLQKEKSEYNEKLKKTEVSLIEERKRVIEAEKQIAELEEIIQNSNVQKERDKMREEHENLQIKNITSQLER